MRTSGIETAAGNTAPLSSEERATRPVVFRANKDDDAEQIDGVSVRHRFVEAPGSVKPIKWHYVEGGVESAQPILLVHGHPFSWMYWKPLIAALAAAKYRVVAVDLKGYGQSEKTPGDWRSPQVAEELLAFCDAIGIARFALVAADRGTAICDHLVARHPSRITKYVRVGAPNECELEGDHEYEAWHREPLWATDMLADTSRYFVGIVEPQLKSKLPEPLWISLEEQFAYPGVAAAVPRYFQESNFQKDRSDRHQLFPKMRCPVLDLRGEATRYIQTLDPSATRSASWTTKSISGAGTYVILDASDTASKAILTFLNETKDADAGEPLTVASPSYVPKQGALPNGVPLVVNHDGEVEKLNGVDVTHRFLEVSGVKWHFVEAGQPKGETIVYLHGHPESWYGGKHQIAHFADKYRIIAPDLKGYGQSEKRPGEYRHEFVAEELIGLFDAIGVKTFNLIAHDRGAVQADYIGGKHPERVLRYVRMQQIGHLLLPTNSPQERLFRDPHAGPRLFADPKAVYDRQWARFKMKPIDQAHLKRMMSEIGHPGFCDAVPRYFQSSSFQKELYDRTVRLFKNMNFPVLILQAGEDVGQPRWYYDDPSRPITELLPNARIEWVEGAGHFTAINHPQLLTDAIARFFAQSCNAPPHTGLPLNV